MPEEVLFEEERRRSRDEIAETLRTLADRLAAGDPLTFSAGDRSVTVDPPDRPEFEVSVERETSPGGGPGELSIELEIAWDESRDESEPVGDESLRIE